MLQSFLHTSCIVSVGDFFASRISLRFWGSLKIYFFLFLFFLSFFLIAQKQTSILENSPFIRFLLYFSSLKHYIAKFNFMCTAADHRSLLFTTSLHKPRHAFSGICILSVLFSIWHCLCTYKGLFAAEL